MGAHHRNPVAIANAVPKQQVQAIDLGEGYGLLRFELHPVKLAAEDGTEAMGVALVAVCGRMSELFPMKPVVLPLAPLVNIPLPELRQKIAAALDGPKEGE